MSALKVIGYAVVGAVSVYAAMKVGELVVKEVEKNKETQNKAVMRIILMTRLTQLRNAILEGKVPNMTEAEKETLKAAEATEKDSTASLAVLTGAAQAINNILIKHNAL